MKLSEEFYNQLKKINHDFINFINQHMHQLDEAVKQKDLQISKLDQQLRQMKAMLNKTIKENTQLKEENEALKRKLEWYELIARFIKNTAHIIEKILLNNKTTECDAHKAILLLKIYFINKEDEKAATWLKSMINQKFLTNTIKLSKKDELETLYISACYGLDSWVTDRHILNSIIPEIQCYKAYRHGIENKDYTNQAINTITTLSSKLTTIDHEVKAIALNKFCIKLRDVIKDRSKKAVNRQTQVLNHNNVIVNEVIEIKKRVGVCPYDGTSLEKCLCDLIYYSSKKREKKEGTISCILLHCQECNKYFINHDFKSEISKSVPINRISIKTIQKNTYRTLKSKVQEASKQNFKITNKSDESLKHCDGDDYMANLKRKIEKGIELTPLEEDYLLDKRKRAHYTNCQTCTNSCNNPNIIACPRYIKDEMKATRIRRMGYHR